jgi:SAM-dependent MidA family methyltransferase
MAVVYNGALDRLRFAPLMSLPVPDPHARAASESLSRAIAAAIEAAGGALPFARFMELALYAPQLGYYTGGAAKLGTAGDFTTAPEMTPLFGATLAHVAASFFGPCAPRIMVFGAGTG